MPDAQLPLIPAPAQLEFESGTFVLDAEVCISIERASTAMLFAARQLQSAIRSATGLSLPLRTSSAARGIALHVDGDQGSPEAYEMRIVPTGVTIRASGEAGLFYAVQTLKQLLKTQGARLPAVHINDRPVLEHRGLMLDVSRGKVPTLTTLFALVDGLANYKYNQLQLYVEHTFDFPSHPSIGAGCDPLTTDDILALDEYCRARHIQLVPNLQSFGHQRHLLSLPEFAHLDEVGWRWSLSPAREETYALLDELYADFLPAFSSDWLNVDCDETWDLAGGQSKALADRIGKGRVYLQHIFRLRELAAKHGRRIILWADVLHHYPDLVSELADDVLLLDWAYDAAEHYATADVLGRSGRQFWVCPGTSSWNTLFPRLDNALGNIRQYVSDGLRAGASGMLLTDWGDYGHYAPLSLSWYAYLFGAATAWTGAQTSPHDFDAAFAPLFLDRPPGDASLNSMRRLSRAVTAPTLDKPNRSNIALCLFEDPVLGRASLEADSTALSEVRAAAEAAVSAFSALPDAALRQDYGFVARLLSFAADKALLTHELRTAQPADLFLERLREARRTARALGSEFETCWLRHARRSEIGTMLAHFDYLDRRYAAAIEWLEQGRDRSSYSGEAFPLLWEQGQADHRHLMQLLGAETPAQPMPDGANA
jgi:hexosaminidase